MHDLLILLLITAAEGKKASNFLPPTDQETEFRQSSPYSDAVDFGHVYRQSFMGENTKKQLDLDNDMHPDVNVKKQEDPSNKNIPGVDKLPLVFLSPRDEIQYYNKNYVGGSKPQLSKTKKTDVKENEIKNITQPVMYDFTKLLEGNLGNPLASRRGKTYPEKFNNYDNNLKTERVNASSYFEDHLFLKKSSFNRKTNWTTCDEFAKRAVFHPDDIVNTHWLPFYIWSQRKFAISVVHTFSYPTKKTVERYKATYGPYLTKVNWREPKLLLKERREILLIAGDRRGLFYGIPDQEIPPHVTGTYNLPFLTLRMKIRDPYLAFMYCDEHYAVIMAELGTGPQTELDKTQEASILKFRGKGKPAFQDMEGERRKADLSRIKKIEAESRKIIKIESHVGDVDYNVKHTGM